MRGIAEIDDANYHATVRQALDMDKKCKAAKNNDNDDTDDGSHQYLTLKKFTLSSSHANASSPIVGGSRTSLSEQQTPDAASKRRQQISEANEYESELAKNIRLIYRRNSQEMNQANVGVKIQELPNDEVAATAMMSAMSMSSQQQQQQSKSKLDLKNDDDSRLSLKSSIRGSKLNAQQDDEEEEEDDDDEFNVAMGEENDDEDGEQQHQSTNVLDELRERSSGVGGERVSSLDRRESVKELNVPKTQKVVAEDEEDEEDSDDIKPMMMPNVAPRKSKQSSHQQQQSQQHRSTADEDDDFF
jgi:hypothetical protein